jgi:hypothetical protein
VRCVADFIAVMNKVRLNAVLFNKVLKKSFSSRIREAGLDVTESGVMEEQYFIHRPGNTHKPACMNSRCLVKNCNWKIVVQGKLVTQKIDPAVNLSTKFGKLVLGKVFLPLTEIVGNDEVVNNVCDSVKCGIKFYSTHYLSFST